MYDAVQGVISFVHVCRKEKCGGALFFGNSKKSIGARGFEHPTSWSQTRRSTKLSYAPYLEGKITRLRRLSRGIPGVELFHLRGRDDRGCRAVPEDVHRGPHHVEDAVGGHDNGNGLERQAEGLQDDDDGHQAGRGDTGHADRGEQGEHHDKELLGPIEADAVKLRDEEDDRALVERGAVHIHGRTQRQGETGHPGRNAGIFLHALHCHRQRGG